MAGVGLPHAAIAEQVQRGIDLVVHLQRRPDGSRVVTEIAEVVRAAGGTAVREHAHRRRATAAAVDRAPGPGTGDCAGEPGADGGSTRPDLENRE